MGIAKDIHQTKFRNERHKALINILFTYGWAVERLKELFPKTGSPTSNSIFFAF